MGLFFLILTCALSGGLSLAALIAPDHEHTLSYARHALRVLVALPIPGWLWTGLSG